eukprot:m.51594 g.51594  ORF g.51594 m.51594 type:complete len:220 (+) comp13005_c0_seq2:135-794(+)
MAGRPESVPSYLLSEVKLYEHASDRERYDCLADVFAILQTLEGLEGAYVKDAVAPAEYETACKALMAQFKTAVVRVSAADLGGDVDKFIETYQLQCKSAMRRLQVGVPATVEHGAHRDGEENTAKFVARATAIILTTLDRLVMGQPQIKDILPSIKDLLANFNSIPALPAEFEGKVMCRKWLEIMNPKNVFTDLTEDEVKQLQFDFETANDEFARFLEH